MNPGQTFERVYTLLKAQIEGGRFRPGDRIDPSLLASDLASSVTPVRDALYRLTGERLVLAIPALGFRMPLLTEPSLRDLYFWNETILLIAIARKAASPQSRNQRESDVTHRTRDLFEAIAGVPGTEIHATVQSNNDRLHRARIEEVRHINDAVAELDAIDALLESEDWPRLRQAVRGYHRRRQRIAGLVINRLNEL
jgi:DNA-binding GntR family transcriptional regulator